MKGDIYKVMELEQTLDLDRYVPGLLTFLSNKMSIGASVVYNQMFNINITEWRIMSLLAIEQPITAKRICEVIGLDKGTVSRSLARLDKDGMINIQVNPQDRRETLILLTRSGAELHNKIIKIALEREQKMLEPLSEADKDEFIRMLNVLNKHIVKLNESLN